MLAWPYHVRKIRYRLSTLLLFIHRYCVANRGTGYRKGITCVTALGFVVNSSALYRVSERAFGRNQYHYNGGTRAGTNSPVDELRL